MKKLFELTKADLNVCDFASTDDSRPLLGGVLVRLKKGRYELVATDSYTLIIHAPKQEVKEQFEPFIMPAEVLKRVRAYIGAVSRGQPKTVELWTDRIVMPEIGVSVSYAIMEGKWPNVDKVIKDAEASVNRAPGVMLNPTYVATTMKFFASMDRYSGVEIIVRGALEAVTLKTDQSYAVIMPLKS